MPALHPPTTVDDAFFQPLAGLATASQQTRACPDFADADFLHLGVQRVLELSVSGRAFLQEHGVRFDHTPGHSNYFAALHSPRRRDVLRDVHRALLIHDKAVIDFDYWQRCRRECAVYIISRVKENMVYEWTGSRLWNRADPGNHGVTTRDGHALAHHLLHRSGERPEL